MPIIKLDATDSTNLYLKKLVLSQPIEDFTVVSAELQQKGRGQMGTEWSSQKGKNLTFSILKRLNDFQVQNQFDLNCIVSLAVYNVLNELTVPNLSVKWPNDILSGNQKICGILIENILKGKLIHSSVIGIGINVNQTDFGTIEKATSLKLVFGANFNLDELLEMLLAKLKFYFSSPHENLRDDYIKKMYRKDKASTFKNAKNEKFTGIIRGVDSTGLLIVELEDEVIKKFGFKEISLLY
ncbi:biotin--[acetyl-CoA-carboxylase] ligase [Croceitalea sp. MTPC9]|uniref:biotin--[acetyl-CoA-carboxylase] ligase n=1 Tax=unclassified Croceitalea TaxID=2632280 RepID=UPI002B3F0B5C|nr:biotin--[acetyl-CoA-carboxylase] ligase [Croceitalea sp. MTPC6]GMN18283.1 biotin--[acetyl-CoA-carboxylase] ligase [Croceitalea sp. MTPC9]